MAPRPRDRRLRRLHLRLTLGWAGAWLLCVAALCALAIATHARLSRLDFESAMQLRASAVYGLTWFDERGAFHDELLRREPGVLDEAVDIWVIAPGTPPRVLLAPPRPRFDLQARFARVDAWVAGAQDFAEEGRDGRGRAYRLQARVTYDDQDRPRALILVVADPALRDAAQAAFVRNTLLIVAALAALGLLLGNLLARRALRPVVQSFEMQERFIASAAHELRAPVANLRALCESAAAGDDSPQRALDRVGDIALQASGLVDKLLLLARLDSGGAPLQKQSLRLDLLAEAALPDDGSVALEARESVVQADPVLLQSALRNLVENALAHGRRDGAPAAVRVTVGAGWVTVEDDGPGFPESLRQRLAQPFVASAGSRGAGLGLSIVRHIAQLHGGSLSLENRESGGARAVLRLPD
ncbi:HAMP domain-containing histidine kinase [Lysobacter sp. BMK333-48F3]|uniref:sensor histidine kinase n=1 Tax=Lysobacter sp. BMK333-48F3 TaxID=2867962 RepID=UPI001C8C6E45|nr:HAMP domain-containing sensor histidine kinase [Lysobacter sp. BMK333-48F3]MBX9402624.1 HAMP domain-containing histidine kinase [Lysobacter sp. BMK333-48F3]